MRRYEFCVRGVSPDRLVETFGDLTVVPGPEGTVVAGPLRDEAALYGVLATITDLGLELVWFDQIDEGHAREDRGDAGT